MIYPAGRPRVPITDRKFKDIMPDVVKFYADTLKLVDKEPTFAFAQGRGKRCESAIRLVVHQGVFGQDG